MRTVLCSPKDKPDSLGNCLFSLLTNGYVTYTAKVNDRLGSCIAKAIAPNSRQMGSVWSNTLILIEGVSFAPSIK